MVMYVRREAGVDLVLDACQKEDDDVLGLAGVAGQDEWAYSIRRCWHLRHRKWRQ